MKINLNIIKFFIVFLYFSELIQATWLDACQIINCDGCSSIEEQIKDAAKKIDTRHKELEEKIGKQYENQIIATLEKINEREHKITQSIGFIRAMEERANVETEHIVFLLRKNKDFYTLPIGVRE